MENRFRRRLVNERVCWQKVFHSKRLREDGELPVKLEICSGHGEWVVAQAKAECGIANWAAVELRHDRLCKIFSRMVLETAGNLCILGGDAAKILPQYILPCS